jgi:hypothetical protein
VRPAETPVFDSTFVAVSCPRPGETVVKLMGTSYAKKIIDLHKSNPFLPNFMELNSANWCVNISIATDIQGLA